MSSWVIFTVSAAYFSALFGLALLMERRASSWMRGRLGGLAYALSLAVYCTSWTFFGSVGRASTGGISFLAVYMGPIAVFLLGAPMLQRLVRIARENRATSIADFISSRHDGSRALAVMVTLVAIIGILPYITLQLKAVSTSLTILLDGPLSASRSVESRPMVIADPAFLVTLILALFCIVFGTRRIDASEQHAGLVSMVALESIVKLVAFIAVGAFVTWGMFGGWTDMVSRLPVEHSTRMLDFQGQILSADWWAVFVVSALAILCLPRQFQVLVVENVRPEHLRTARWLFPSYLLAMNVFVLPIAVAGVILLQEKGVAADTFVLALPLVAEKPGLGLLAFIGGLSAATAMVLIEVTALSTMVSNDLVLPTMLRHLMTVDGGPIKAVKLVRRLAIVGGLGLAYLYLRVIGESYTLVSIGLVSFVASAQFGPALLAGIFLNRRSRRGALMGLGAGFLVWCYTLLLPSFARSGWLPVEFVHLGLLGESGPPPHSLFWLGGLNEISRALVLSLSANILLYITGMALDRRHGARSATEVPASLMVGEGVGRQDLEDLVGRFIGEERARTAFQAQPDARGREVVAMAEHLLTGAIGSASARVVIAATLGGEWLDAGSMRGMLKDASAAIESGRAAMADALGHLGQGVVVVDAELRLVAWNQRFVELLNLPEDCVGYGKSLLLAMRHNALNGDYGEGDPERLVAERERMLRSGRSLHEERERLDGTVLEIRRKPLPSGGFVSTYTDVTRRVRAEQELRRSHEELERRVVERTRALSEEVAIRARAEAELLASRERLKGVTDSLFEGVIVVDASGRLTFANPSARSFFGIEASGDGIGDCFFSAAVKIKSKAGTVGFEESPFGQALRDGMAVRDDDAVFVTADGRERSIAYACNPVGGDEAGRSLVISFRDVSQLKQAQREALQASRMASVGQLAAGIAHEINTPIQYIGDNLRFIRTSIGKLVSLGHAAAGLAQRLDGDDAGAPLAAELAAAKIGFLADELPVAVDESLDGVEQIARIVLSMKEFSHPGTSSKTRTDINRALSSTLTVSHNAWKQFAEVETRFASDLPPVLCHTGEVNQVFLNLIINAAQAIEAAGKPLPGRIIITTRHMDGVVEVEISDTGTGVPEGLRDRIFDPFFTTKDVGKGTGQGLAICRDVIVTKHGGALEVGGAAGDGAVFTIRLPADHPDERPQESEGAGDIHT